MRALLNRIRATFGIRTVDASIQQFAQLSEDLNRIYAARVRERERFAAKSNIAAQEAARASRIAAKIEEIIK